MKTTNLIIAIVVSAGLAFGVAAQATEEKETAVEMKDLPAAVQKTIKEKAAGGDIVISPDMYERLWRMAETEQTTIHTKHEGDFVAYRVKRLKTGAELDTRGLME